MAGGWARDGAVQDQIDDTIADGVKHARGQMPTGESALYCVVCEEEIPEARRLAVPGVKTCVHCQSKNDNRIPPGFNRRGSKDSQLR